MLKLVDISQIVLKTILTFRQCIFTIFIIISFWRKGGVLHWNKHEYLSPKDPFVPCLVEIGPAALDSLLMYFHHYFIIFPRKRTGPFLWIVVNPLHSKMICAKFGWNWPSRSGEKDFIKFLPCIFTINFIIISLWPFIWRNLNFLYPRMLCA